MRAWRADARLAVCTKANNRGGRMNAIYEAMTTAILERHHRGGRGLTVTETGPAHVNAECHTHNACRGQTYTRNTWKKPGWFHRAQPSSDEGQ